MFMSADPAEAISAERGEVEGESRLGSVKGV